MYAFGAGVVVGIGMGFAVRVALPKPLQIAGAILEKLGFNFTDILLLAWNPEGPLTQVTKVTQTSLPPAKIVKARKKKRKAPIARRNSGRALKLPARTKIQAVRDATAFASLN